MAAGLGFKTFTTGEVLTAADVNGYLMQGILVFATEASRNSAITSPQEGQFAFTKDNNSLWYYTGSAWVASGATGDIEGVTAGVGISGGGTSGTVTITNSMATAIDAKGDLIAGTGADTFDKLTVGSNNTVLTADSTTATGLKWATPAGGSLDFTLLNAGGTALTGSGTITISSINHKALFIKIVSGSTASAGDIKLRFNSDSGSNYDYNSVGFIATAASADSSFGSDGMIFANVGNAASSIATSMLVWGADKTGYKPVQIVNSGNTAQTGAKSWVVGGGYFGSSAISSVSVVAGSNWDAGTIYVYGAA